MSCSTARHVLVVISKIPRSGVARVLFSNRTFINGDK